MKVHILGRDRWYYSNKTVAKMRALLFKMQGYEVIISTCYLLDNGQSSPYYIGNYEVNERPDNTVDGVWFRVIPFVRVKGNVARSCAT